MATSTTTSTTTPVTTKDMKSKFYLSMPRIPPKVYLKTVNEHITCKLCEGYLIDATTIVECLHSFCHSCLTKHLIHSEFCPRCEILINISKPNIKPDATLQAIVYKLVPGLYEKELLRRRAFYKLKTKEAKEATPEQRGDDTEHLIFSPNESISLMLEYSDNNDAAPQNNDDENSNSSHEINSSDHCDDDFEVQLRKPKYLQCPAIFTISNLKKFLLHKFSINPNKFCVEIMYKVKSLALPDHYKLMDVAYIFTWKRDAPMRFLYCVRAAHLPVPNIEQSAVMYDLPPSRFQTNSQLVCASDSTDQDQSSDADSEARSDRTREPETNGSMTRTSRDEPINSTSDEPSVPSSSTLSTTKTASSTTVTSTSVASTSSKLNSSARAASLNGNESQKKESLEKVSKESSPTTSGRLESMPRIKTEPLSPSPEKQQQSDRRSNGESPKPNTSKSRNTTDVKSSSPSRTNQDLKDSKEKVKTKSIMMDSSATRSGDSMSNRGEQKTVTFSDKSSSNWPSMTSMNTNDSKSISNAERPKGRLLFNKDEKAKSLSPPLSAENEYDFDQHLMKVEFSEKKEFFEKIHLKPRTDSPLVQSPKMPKIQQKTDLITLPTNLSKDKDNNKTTATTTTTITSLTNNASGSSSMRPTVSSSLSLASSLSGSSASSVDKQFGKRPEKTSKRKSREPVKNVPKTKCASPNERTIDTKWDPVKSTIISTVSPSSPVSTATTSRSLGSNNNSSSSSNSSSLSVDRAKEAALLMNQFSQHKNHQKSSQSSSTSSLSAIKSNLASSSKFTSSSKSVFKTPISSSSKESSSSTTNLKPSISESETSIIIQHNIQRPHQADTPRPSTSFDISPHPVRYPPALGRHFFMETEIQEIRSDDKNKEKVYGPTHCFHPPYVLPIPNYNSLLPTTPISKQIENYFKQQLPYKINKQRKPNSDGIKQRQNLDAKGYNQRSLSHTKIDSTKQKQQQQQPQSSSVPQLHPLLNLPKSLTITVTNDGNDADRSSFSTKNSSVVNSIDIVKLPFESGETNAKFPSPSTSTSVNTDNSWQSNKNLNIQSKQNTQQNNQIDSTSTIPQSQTSDSTLSHSKLDSSFQSKFIASLAPTPTQVAAVIRSNLNMVDDAQKRKMQQQHDDKAAKVRKIQSQQTVTQQKSSPTTQRPVPDLLIPKDDKKLSNSTSTTTVSGSSSNTNSIGNSGSSGSSTGSSTNNTNQLANSKNSQERKSSNVTASNISSSDRTAALSLAVQQVTQAKVQSPTYMPLQTSSTPIWKSHCTPDQLASHRSLAESLTQSKKSSGTFVD